jgi:hypothetical protein
MVIFPGMEPETLSLAQICRQPAPRSLWYHRLRQRAGQAPVHAWLIEQANLRGFHGAYNAHSYSAQVDPELTLEDILVGLLSPQAPADGRTFKLVVRILQSGKVDAQRLALQARRERAEGVLHWLLHLVPSTEHTPALVALQEKFATPPRGDRGVRYTYDAERLVRRPAGRLQLWRAKRH